MYRIKRLADPADNSDKHGATEESTDINRCSDDEKSETEIKKIICVCENQKSEESVQLISWKADDTIKEIIFRMIKEQELRDSPSFELVDNRKSNDTYIYFFRIQNSDFSTQRFHIRLILKLVATRYADLVEEYKIQMNLTYEMLYSFLTGAPALSMLPLSSIRGSLSNGYAMICKISKGSFGECIETYVAKDKLLDTRSIRCQIQNFLSDVLLSLLLYFVTPGFPFDLFFAFRLNTLILQSDNAAFHHLPLVTGEAETLKRLLYDAAFAHKTNLALFLKVAYRAEIFITYSISREDALRFYSYCIHVASEIGDEVAEARMLIIFGQLLGKSKKHLSLASKKFRRALTLLEARGKSTDLAWLLTSTGWNLFSRGLPGLGVAGREYLVQACDMFQEILDFSSNTFRKSFLFTQGQSALEEDEQRLEEKLAASLSSLGLVQLYLNEPREALKYLQRSNKIRLGQWEQHPSIGNGYNNISLCYQRMGQTEKALENSLEGLRVKRECKGSSKELVTSLNNVAINCMIAGIHEKAINLLEEALKLHEENDIDVSHTATIYTSLAFVYQRMERLSEAVSWSRKAVALRVEIHGSTHVTTVRLNNRLVSILLQMKEYKEAQIILEEQIIANQSSNVCEDLDKSLEMLGSVYLKIGEDAKANLVQQKSISELISLLNIEKDAKSKQNDSIQDDIYHNGSRENVGAPKETCYDKEHELGCEGRNHSLELTESASPALTDQKIEEVARVGEDEPNDNFSDLDEIDSDDDLYGAEDTTSYHSGHQNIIEDATQTSFKTTDQQIQNDDNGVSESHVDVIPNANKEDDDHMSVSSSPEPICDDDDNQNDAEDNKFHTCIGITANISSANQILEPLAQTKSLPHRQSKQIQPKSMVSSRVLPVSSQSAFTTVGNSSLNINNNVLKTTVPDNHMPNLYHSFTQVKGQPISQPSQEARKPLKTSTGATGKQSNRFAAKFTNSSPNVNNCPGNSPHVPLRQSDNPFLSCQIGYQQFHPKPTYVQSLPFIGSANEKAAVENTPHFGVDNHRSTTEYLSQVRSNHKPTFEELEDIKWLTPKEIDASRNVLRLILGEFSEDSDENLFD